MPLIIGLGNPGNKYVGTRHNIGFELIDKLANERSISLKSGRGSFYTGKGNYKGQSIYLVKPTTYMNNSGDAVQQVLNWYKKSAEDCLVCYDDLALEVGTIRLRRNGSSGGHNGIKDIIQKLGTDDFPRLRIGIGNDFPNGQQVGHVLSQFSSRERKKIDTVLDKAADATFCFINRGIEQAMNKFN